MSLQRQIQYGKMSVTKDGLKENTMLARMGDLQHRLVIVNNVKVIDRLYAPSGRSGSLLMTLVFDLRCSPVPSIQMY